jgi:hypothetical protein
LTKYLIDKIHIDKTIGAIVIIGFEKFGIGSLEIGGGFGGGCWE